MMCDVMPTISEDGSADRDSSYSGDDANFEQLMVNMLDERDKLMETLRETQDNMAHTQSKLHETERERDALQTQLQATTTAVSLPLVVFLRRGASCFIFGLIVKRHKQLHYSCDISHGTYCDCNAINWYLAHLPCKSCSLVPVYQTPCAILSS